MKLKEEDLNKMGVKIKNLKLYLPLLNQYLEEFQINTPNRFSFFFANILHETGDLVYMKEIHDGSNYEGRRDLGNINFGDGKRYPGVGWIMTTGRRNYKAFTAWCRGRISQSEPDFEKFPEKMLEPKYSILSSFWFYEVNKLEKYADAGDFKNFCSVINTGRVQDPKKPHTINGYEDRLKKLDKVVSWLQTIIK